MKFIFLVIFDFQIPLFFVFKDECCLFEVFFCHQLFILPTMRITFYFSAPAEWDLRMDQQGGITAKPSVLWFYPDANRRRIQSSVTTVVLQSLQGWFHPTSCLLRERKLLLSGISGQVKPSPAFWAQKNSRILSSRANQVVTGLQMVFSAAPALHSSVQNIRHNWRFIVVLGFVWSHSSFPNDHLGLKYWWLCIARGVLCVAY